MATKRTPPSDIESPPLQHKHPRLEGQTQLLGDIAPASSLPLIPLSNTTSMPAQLIPIPLAPASISMKMHPHIPVSAEGIELPCSSPSGFLHPPLLTSSASASSSDALPVTSESSNRQPLCSIDANSFRRNRSKAVQSLRNELLLLKSAHDASLREMFFLENGGNLMDFLIWRKKPNVLRDQYMKQHELDLSSDTTDFSEANMSKIEKKNPLPFSTTIQIPLSTVSPTLHATPPKGSTSPFPGSSPRPATRAHASFSTVYENSHEDIVMRARHEAEVMKAISELRKEGLWSASRLPKVQEPARIKTHWDYLLEEMQWLASDFANEKRWKINAARKVCIMDIA